VGNALRVERSVRKSLTWRAEARLSSRTETITQALRRAVISGEIAPGQVLFEGDLAHRFRVSKTPVREALSVLQAQGLLRVIPYRGYLVAPVTLTDVKDLFETRIMLEEAIAGLAAERISEESLARLEEISRSDLTFPNQTSEDRFAWMAQNKAFHLEITRATGNHELVSIMDLLLDKISRVVFLYYSKASLEEHRAGHAKIVDALRLRKVAPARQAMREHIEVTCTSALTILKGSNPNGLSIAERRKGS
jgi:DNA-binding GntR family transcriptional regulator